MPRLTRFTRAARQTPAGRRGHLGPGRYPRPRRGPLPVLPALAAGLLLAALALSGCSGSGDGGGPPSTNGATGGPAATGPSAAPRGTPTASRTTRIQAPDGEVEIGFVGLRVQGQLARLDLIFTPRYADDPATGITLFDMAGRRDAAVTLVDAENLRRYTVVRDSGGASLGAGSGTTRTRNNVPVAGSFTFAAPPSDVTTVDVYLNDQVVVDDAQITR